MQSTVRRSEGSGMRVSRLITNRRLFILLGSFILLIVIAGMTLRGRERAATLPERVIMDVQNTVGGWIYRPVSQFSSFLVGIHSLHEMYLENSRLQSEMQNYDALKTKLGDVEAENERLNKMLNYKQSQSTKTHLTPAHVIGRDPTQWNSVLTIDVGQSDGVQSNLAVVAADGSLVGRVAEVARNSAKVILITDTQVGDGVSSKVENGTAEPTFGIVTGSTTANGKLDMSFLSPVAQVQVGNVIETSGLSDVFPSNLIIGTVDSVRSGSQGLTQSAVVTPSADLDYLQNVFVVSSTGAKK
jgi:rod shape-determining protein MreC